MESKRFKKIGNGRWHWIFRNENGESMESKKSMAPSYSHALTPAQKERIRRQLVQELTAKKHLLERKLRLLEDLDGFAETENRDLA
ncbi:MAG: hypothetical protein ABSG35_14130 [Syntrophobacteraceae bacterium]|jgi:hypothetical protein